MVTARVAIVTDLLRNIFRLGLFENPYLNPEESAKIVGNPEFMKAGYDAQLKSIIMLKNRGQVLPIDKKKTVYIPKVYNEPQRNWWGVYTEGNIAYPVNIENVKKYFNVTDDPQKTVEQQFEDVPFDMECHKDSEGNVYDFGFGLNWKGVIKDARTAKYKRN